MNHRYWRVFLTGLLILNALWLLGACSGSSATGSTDGDTDDEYIIDDNAVDCIDDTDCTSCQFCIATADGKKCAKQACVDNLDCAEYGAGAYCQGGLFCVCPGGIDPDGDGSEVIDGDIVTGALSVSPSSLNFGAVKLGEKICKELHILNDSSKIVQLNSSLIIQDGRSSEDAEFYLEGAPPTEDNIIVLASGDTYDGRVCYEPADPGEDSGQLIIGSTVGLLRIPLESEVKGFPVLMAFCEQLDPDYEAHDAEWAGASSFDLVPLGSMVPMQCTLKNEPPDPSTNATLVVDDLELFDPDHPDSAINKDYEIDEDSIDYWENTTEIWLGAGEEEIFTLLYHPYSRGVHKLHLRIHHNDPQEEKPKVLKIIGAGVVPELSVDPLNIDFGLVPKGQCKTINVILTNRGGTDLSLESVNLRDHQGNLDQVFGLNLDPDADTNDNVPGIIPPPGEAEDNFTSVDLTCCPVDRMAYTNILEVISDHEAHDRYLEPVPVTCTGIMASCDIFPSELDFGCLRVGNTETRFVTINNGGGATARINTVSLSGSYNFEIVGILDLPLDIPSGSSFEIGVNYTATAPGTEQAELLIEPRVGDCPETIIPLTGCGMEPVIDGPDDCISWEDAQVPPDDLPPEQAEEWESPQQITIHNEGNDTLTIYEVFLPQAFENWFNLYTNALPAIVPPGGYWTFKVGYTPESYGEHNGSVVLCTDASNAGGSDFSCSSPQATASEICLVGSAIDPRMFIEPSTGRWTFSGVTVGEGPSDPKTVRITNQGNGPVTISGIEMGSAFDETITLVGMRYNDDDIFGNYPAEGIALQKTETLDVTVQCEPINPGHHHREMVITHNDMDMTKPGGVAGSEHPDYIFLFNCVSEDNLPPTAIVKSPAGTPAGPYGSRERNISKGECINLDGSASFDDNHRPEAEPPELDPIVNYEWTADNGVQFIMPTSGPTASITQACFNSNGVYTVTLKVQDSHGTWSETSFLDSKLKVTVEEAPVARAFQCDTFMTYINTETGIEICFDGSASSDPDGTIEEYFWYVQKLGGQKLNFATSASANYTFTDPGSYEVTLVVKDNDGNDSQPDKVDVEAYSDESMRLELTWTGRGDVDLHYLRPNGYPYDISDCYVGNPAPNWGPQGFGHPQHIQGSLDGVSPEIVQHADPGDGPPSYTVMATYETPTQDCGYVYETKHYSNNCDMCDCDCKPFCLILRICCNSCDKTTQRWVCEDVPALLNYKVFINDAPYATCVVSGPTVKVATEGATHSFNMSRIEGKWFCP